MEKVEQKKSMLYFSGGLSRQGIENQASIRAATNECVKADTAIYARGYPRAAGAEHCRRRIAGQPPRHRSLQRSRHAEQLNANFSSQETLGTLASDTGGKLFSTPTTSAPPSSRSSTTPRPTTSSASTPPIRRAMAAIGT